MAGAALPLGRDAICDIIPHRQPFLLVDEITELEAGVRAVGSYLVKDDAWYLAGHFPGNPIMPGVLQVEALAQVGAICGLAHPDFAGRLVLFAGIDDVRFKR
ncbi:MAG: 3-hydroxyacyl-ACP dehydratase FabZ family protein, partial [Gaiellales bacterium]